MEKKKGGGEKKKKKAKHEAKAFKHLWLSALRQMDLQK